MRRVMKATDSACAKRRSMLLLGIGVWTILLGLILCPAASAFTASDLANGWTWYGEYGAVLTTWEPPSGTEASRIVGAEIWRDDGIREIILQGDFEFEDGYWIDGSEYPGIQILEFEIDPVTGAISSINRDFIAWRPEVDEEGNLDPTWEEFLYDNWDELGIDWTMTSVRYGWVPEGPVIGRLQIYRIRPIILVQYHIAPGIYQWRLTSGEFSSINNWVVPVGPPLLVSPEITGNLATIEFYSSYGTDEAIIQVARDLGPGVNLTNLFLPERTYSQISVVNPYDPDGNRVTVEVDLAQVPGTGNIFWWRAGGRNRRSTCQPRPWPSISTDYGWVWSDSEWLRVGNFSDVSPGHWAFAEVEALCQAGIVHGYPDGTYRPTYSVSRDQMAVYISRTITNGDGNVPEGPEQATFTDVSTDFWAYRYVEYAVANDVVRGYPEGDYRPLEPVNRGAMTVYIARASGWVSIDADMDTAPELFPDVPAGFWAGTAIEACVENGVVQGYPDGTYKPEGIVTRDQMAVYIYRAFLE